MRMYECSNGRMGECANEALYEMALKAINSRSRSCSRPSWRASRCPTLPLRLVQGFAMLSIGSFHRLSPILQKLSMLFQVTRKLILPVRTDRKYLLGLAEDYNCPRSHSTFYGWPPSAASCKFRRFVSPDKIRLHLRTSFVRFSSANIAEMRTRRLLTPPWS